MHKCDFCGKDETQVTKLIAGPGVDICDECVIFCMQVLTTELVNDSRKLSLVRRNIEN